MTLLGLVFGILFFSVNVFATSGPACGPEVNVVKRLLTDAEKVRAKCIDDFYKQKKEEARQLGMALQADIKLQKDVLRRTAYKYSGNMVSCDFPKTQDSEGRLKQQCRLENEKLTALIVALDKSQGWEALLAAPVSSAASSGPDVMEMPCPDSATLEKIRPIRYFKRKHYQVYERCFSLAP